MKGDLPARPHTQPATAQEPTAGEYTVDEVWAQVDNVSIALEMAACRFGDDVVTPPMILADDALNGCNVL